jgi:hypothetical protein
MSQCDGGDEIKDVEMSGTWSIHAWGQIKHAYIII